MSLLFSKILETQRRRHSFVSFFYSHSLFFAASVVIHSFFAMKTSKIASHDVVIHSYTHASQTRLFIFYVINSNDCYFGCCYMACTHTAPSYFYFTLINYHYYYYFDLRLNGMVIVIHPLLLVICQSLFMFVYVGNLLLSIHVVSV